VIGCSVAVLVTSPPSSGVLAGALVLALLGWLADRVPVPVNNDGFSLAYVFFLCAAVMYGVAVAAILAAAVVAATEIERRRRPVVAAYNVAMWALVGGAAGVAGSVGRVSDLQLILAVLLAAAGLFTINIALIAAVVGDARLRDAGTFARSIARQGLVPFSLGVSLVPLFVTCWRTSPLIAVTAAVPLLAIGLHLRSQDESRQATMLALTDPLTGLGNRRHFTERLQQELARAEGSGHPLSVCLIDVDDFKSINDDHGHETGDLTLVALAGTLRQGGEAFRVGGDEFALLLPEHDPERAAAVAAAVTARVVELREPPGLQLSISTGTSSYRGDGRGRDELLRVADQALYQVKELRRSDHERRR
jgi:diguanylate cyclase (GGDEF)-like protein